MLSNVSNEQELAFCRVTFKPKVHVRYYAAQWKKNVLFTESLKRL